MKPKHFFLSLFALLASINAFAYDAEIDGIYYDFSSDEAIVTSRDIWDYYNSYSGTVIIPQTVTYDGKTYSVTSIGSRAFYGCSGLTSVTIPNSVTSIGISAFSDCSGLTSVTIPNSVTSIDEAAFSGCSGLTSVTIPNSVTSIGYGAFSGCSGLTSVTIPESVTSIGSYAFQYCSGLTSIAVESGNTVYDSRNNCNAIIETATNTLIAGCMNTIIPESVTSIGDGIFSDWSSLTSFTIPESVTSIGSNVFSGCSGLTSVTIPESLTSIGSNAFYGCSSLTSITIPESVTSIGYGAFSGCSGLTSVTIPESLTSIGSSTFQGCSSLTSVTIPNSVTDIGYGAFSGCSGLTSVTIGNSVTSIGADAFYDCKLRNVLVKCTAPPSLGTTLNSRTPFSNQTYYHTTLYIPAGCWDAYAYDDYWYNFINIRETATREEEVSRQQAYTLMDAGTFAYSVYDPVNDCIGTINSVSSIDENNPNHSWQMMEANGMHYLYNIGAKKFVRREGSRLALTSSAEPIDVADGADGIVLAEQKDRQWILVSNERMSVDQAIITGVEDVNVNLNVNNELYNLAGQRMTRMQRGLYIRNGQKVIVK